MSRRMSCNGCTRCKDVGGEKCLRPRYRAEYCFVDDKVGVPIELLGIAMHCIDVYVNRETVQRSRKESLRKRTYAQMQVADRTEGDSIRLLPMTEYIHEYRESHPSEYKGGHHASPVEHVRSGYFRKSRIGNYIRKDGQFVEVPKSLGTFTFVHSIRVNAGSDNVQVNVI